MCDAYLTVRDMQVHLIIFSMQRLIVGLIIFFSLRVVAGSITLNPRVAVYCHFLFPTDQLQSAKGATIVISHSCGNLEH